VSKLDVNILDKIDRARKLIDKIAFFGDKDAFEEMEKALEEFDEIFTSSDHPEIAQLYAKSLSNALVDFNRIQAEKKSVFYLSKLESVYNSNFGNLAVEMYSMGLAGIIRIYSNQNNVDESRKYLEKLNAVYTEYPSEQFVLEQFGVSLYNLLLAEGNVNNLDEVKNILEILIKLHTQFPQGMFNIFVLQGIGNVISYFGKAGEIEDFPRLLEICRKIYFKRYRIRPPKILEHQYPVHQRDSMCDGAYVGALYNAGKYYGIYGQIENMERRLIDLEELFKIPASLFNHNPVAGEQLGIAFRNACLSLIKANLPQKLDETISRFEKLFKRYPIRRFNFDGELANAMLLAQQYFISIDDQKRARKYEKRSRRYAQIKKERGPYTAKGSDRYVCIACQASWNVTLMSYEYEDIKEDITMGETEKCPRCNSPNIKKEAIY
jgi:tetratricopeptide (TPR) repeat protein